MSIHYQNYISAVQPPPALSPRAPAAPPRDSKVNIMKMTVRIIVFCVALAAADSKDPARIENGEIKYHQLDVPGKEPITVIETSPSNVRQHWQDYSRDFKDHDNIEIKHAMTDIIHDTDGHPRCFGPSCQEAFTDNDGPQKDLNDYFTNSEKFKDYSDFQMSMQALAAKLKKDKYKSDHYTSDSAEQVHSDEEDNAKVYTSWNRLKVKQHKHPYDDKEGWVTLEPVAWSTSKISKWKPNVKKQKPNVWNEDDDRPDRPDSDRYDPYQGIDYNNNYPQTHQQKRPLMNRPTYINNKLHTSSEYESEMPSKPTWNKPTLTQQSTFNYPSSWSPDESRRPHKPNCDSEDQFNDSGANDDTVFYGISDSVITDHRPTKYPFEYEALHQAPYQKRPIRRPTQVIYAGSPELDSDRSSRPPYGDGQWVLLSTTKGYRNKKRQRSLNPTPADDRSDGTTMTSHQAVALTVLPIDSAHTNMTTSHGGLLEVEKSFKTVEESKRDMDKKYDLAFASSLQKPTVNRLVKSKIVSNVAPDSSTVFAAVGAGMLPATMAMVVPMMLGRRRRRRDLNTTPNDSNLNNVFYKYQ